MTEDRFEEILIAADPRPKRILALDPGPAQTGWVRFKDGRVEASGVSGNDEMLDALSDGDLVDLLAIEMIASYGMAVGKDVFETCVWIGRYMQGWYDPKSVKLIYRKDVKMYLCGTPRAKDANIRQALIDLLGPQGSKKNPGPTYGVKSHAWAALAVAVTAANAS